MRLLLVMPTGLQVGYDDYFSASPLGIETLAAHARDLADVELADMRGNKGHDVEAHARELLARGPEMVGVSINSAPHTNYALALAEALKRDRPELIVLAGGQQASFLTEELLGGGHFDAVIRGEGERTLCEVLQRGGDFRGVAGVSWRADGGVHHGPDRPQIEDLDEVRPPARDLLPDRSRYRMGAYRVEGVESSRGCPFHCSFCSIRNFHRGTWRAKGVERVMRDVDGVLERYPEPKVIFFADDNFCHDVERVIAICKAIVERKTDAYFWCQARADLLARRPEMVEWMGRAQFSAVLVGLETPNPRLLKGSRKGISVEQIEKTVEMLHAHDIGIWGTFVLGLPGETPEETDQTAEYIAKTPVDVLQITVATPIPGSDLYDQAKAAGDILEPDWDRFDFTSPTMRGQLPKKQMDAVLHRAYRRVYLSRRFLKSLFRRRTNLDRLRRTAFRVFWAWIWFVIKDYLASWFRRRPAAAPPSGPARGDDAPAPEPGTSTT
ncbi:MAG TPA: radical SAM protein [Phycisphaerae bacterium]|nr:radical SAM protein [Phycisphaerae bacterium]